MALRKDDPVYYKVKMNELLKQAKENNIDVRVEDYTGMWEGICIRIAFSNDIGEIAGVPVSKNILKGSQLR